MLNRKVQILSHFEAYILYTQILVTGKFYCMDSAGSLGCG